VTVTEKKVVKVSRQAVELARLHVEAARKAGRQPDAAVARIAGARPDTGNGAPAPAPA
jgi:ubiquitin